MEELEREIRRRLAAAEETGKIEGLLFHSTCEPIVGPLHGDMLGILWTARSPWVSSQYIPNAGSEILLAKPESWRLRDRVAPEQHGTFYRLACELTGKECGDIQWGHGGRAESWRVPEGWPTYAEIVAHIEEELGYVANENGIYYIRERLDGSVFRIMPAGWQIQGQMFVALDDGLVFKDVRRTGEPDLMEREYYDGDAFDAAEAQGYDGVIINDHCQSDDYGNVPHVSYGINRIGREKVEWISVPTVRRSLVPWFDGESCLTPDVRSWMEGAMEFEPHGL